MCPSLTPGAGGSRRGPAGTGLTSQCQSHGTQTATPLPGHPTNTHCTQHTSRADRLLLAPGMGFLEHKLGGAQDGSHVDGPPACPRFPCGQLSTLGTRTGDQAWASSHPHHPPRCSQGDESCSATGAPLLSAGQEDDQPLHLAGQLTALLEEACPGPAQAGMALRAGTINPAHYFLRASHPINNSGW